jgi:hypothetical protein
MIFGPGYRIESDDMLEMPIQPNLRVYVCIHVFKDERPILLVSRVDGDWCFLCGSTHEQTTDDIVAVGVGHVLERDNSLVPLLDLKPEWEAERSDFVSPWVRSEYFPGKP